MHFIFCEVGALGSTAAVHADVEPWWGESKAETLMPLLDGALIRRDAMVNLISVTPTLGT
jgi:hypothetical protein